MGLVIAPVATSNKSASHALTWHKSSNLFMPVPEHHGMDSFILMSPFGGGIPTTSMHTDFLGAWKFNISIPHLETERYYRTKVADGFAH